MDRIQSLILLIKIAETESLGTAAEALGISKPTASRSLAELEKRLNTRLIERNTRRLFMTESGLELVEQARHIIRQLEEAELNTTRKVENPEGLLRVGASLSFAMHQIAPRLRKFKQHYPNLKVHIEARNQYDDRLPDYLDIAIRTREFEPDSNIIIRRLANTKRVLCAAPAYLARKGIPTTPTDLLNHDFLMYLHANRPTELILSQADEKKTIKLRPVLESNDGQVLRVAALDSLGILAQPNYIVYDDLVSGKLVPLLTNWQLPMLQINMAYPNRQYVPAKTRVFIDFMANEFAQDQVERRWTSQLGLQKAKD